MSSIVWWPQKERKKVGRPISYKGDLGDPDLTEEERRKIKRRCGINEEVDSNTNIEHNCQAS